jgi:glucose-1-phosphate cytidylyltransferase
LSSLTNDSVDKIKEIPVVILCGGAGQRLKEETETKPKPMISIGGKPILWHIMKTYAAYGFKKFVLCLGYKGEVIKDYFYNYDILNHDFTIKLGNPHVQIHSKPTESDWQITLVDTGATSLKGCRIKRIQRYINSDSFMLTYGDGVANVDINDLLSFHKNHGCIGTITGVRPPSRFGEIMAKDGKVLSFAEKPQVSYGLINGGYFILKSDIFNYLSDEESCDFEVGPLEKLAADGELMVYEHKGEWACMDTYRDVLYLNSLWENDKAFWKKW